MRLVYLQQFNNVFFFCTLYHPLDEIIFISLSELPLNEPSDPLRVKVDCLQSITIQTFTQMNRYDFVR